MITAILATTNNLEPWAAKVDFEILKDQTTTWSTILKKKYLHFQNLQKNPRSVIIYNQENLELIMKASALISSDNKNEPEVKVDFKIDWLRVVDKNGTNDFDSTNDIDQQLKNILINL